MVYPRELRERVVAYAYENHAVREAVGLIRKDPGVDPAGLSNRERSLLVDALWDKWPVGALCARLRLPRSFYYRHRGQAARQAKASRRIALGERLRSVSESNWRSYGYRRLTDALQAGV
ncbi:hypothetical protein KIM372_17560 [Bombiscardovia nodaiensis]|uniref:Transposase n=1 Tax=Bombiscardovia nodaiensis TaxID=2932181 RepID=A0ABN6SCP6_9BIFI|nr:hypothetical protein KIM372_17560 [Bombiscardovia nodaiensis]